MKEVKSILNYEPLGPVAQVCVSVFLRNEQAPGSVNQAICLLVRLRKHTLYLRLPLFKSICSKSVLCHFKSI